jgi:transposase
LGAAEDVCYGFAGGYTVVKDHVRLCLARARETFVPRPHSPGHGQVDFGEAVGVIGGVRQKAHFFCMSLPQSDACFVKTYPRETTEAFLDGHVSAFAFFGGVLQNSVQKFPDSRGKQRPKVSTQDHAIIQHLSWMIWGVDLGSDCQNSISPFGGQGEHQRDRA